MKTRKLIRNGILVLATTGLIFTGCKKDEEDNDTSGSSDNALAEASFEEIGGISNEAGHWGTVNYRMGKPADGGTYSVKGIYFYNKDSTNADTIVVDFGAANSVCADGKQRRGKINITYTGQYYVAGTVIEVVPDNYFVNDNQIIGKKTITNNGVNSLGYMAYTDVVDGQIKLANGAGMVTWKANKTFEWQNYANNGWPTLNWQDDVHYLGGSSSGTSSDGHTFSANITKKLVRKMSCAKHFVEGSFDFTPDNKPVRTVDFGGGSCDDIATVVVNGKTYTIHLR